METRQDGASAAGPREWSLSVRPDGWPKIVGRSEAAKNVKSGEIIHVREVVQESQPSTAPAAQGEARPNIWDEHGNSLTGCSMCAILRDRGVTTHPHYATHQPPAASQGMREADLEACAEWLEQAERTGAYSDMSHPALVAWAKAGYPGHFSGWVCGEIARRLRSLTPPSPAPADLEAADMAEVNDRSRERPSKCRECGGPRNWNGNRPPFCPRCLPPASPPPVSQEPSLHDTADSLIRAMIAILSTDEAMLTLSRLQRTWLWQARGYAKRRGWPQGSLPEPAITERKEAESLHDSSYSKIPNNSGGQG